MATKPATWFVKIYLDQNNKDRWLEFNGIEITFVKIKTNEETGENEESKTPFGRSMLKKLEHSLNTFFREHKRKDPYYGYSISFFLDYFDTDDIEFKATSKAFWVIEKVGKKKIRTKLSIPTIESISAAYNEYLNQRQPKTPGYAGFDF